MQTGDERLALRVSGAFGSELDILAINIASNGRLIRLGDIAEVRRTYVDPPQPIFRVNGKPAIGLAIAMREGGDILTLGRNVQRTMDDITADLPVGIEPTLVADQSVRRRRRDRRVHDLVVAGDRDHHGGERAESRR